LNQASEQNFKLQAFRVKTGPQSLERCTTRSQTTGNNGYYCCHSLPFISANVFPHITLASHHFSEKKAFFTVIKSPVYHVCLLLLRATQRPLSEWNTR
jgi:hypothetical protein